MHELSIVTSLLSRVEEHARREGATRVLRVQVKVGEIAGVEIAQLRSAWELARERTCCAGAALELESVAVRWECGRCARSIGPGEVLRCPACGAPAELRAGSELLLERIELEVA